MKLLIVLAIIGAVVSQNYDDGKYRPDNSGRYNGDNGRYVPDAPRVVVRVSPVVKEAPAPAVVQEVVVVARNEAPAPLAVQEVVEVAPKEAPAPVVVQVVEVAQTEAPAPVVVQVVEVAQTEAPAPVVVQEVVEVVKTEAPAPAPVVFVVKQVVATPAPEPEPAAPTTAAPTTQAPTTAAPATTAPVVLVKFVQPVVQNVATRFVEVEPERKYDYKNTEGHWRVISDVKQLSDNGYSFGYETENKIAAQETAQVVDLGDNESFLKVIGFYEYVGDDSVLYRVDYIADKNGFQPVGVHLPKPVEPVV